jgi:hypothetical protein
MFGTDMSDLQEEIVQTYDRNPDAGPKSIAQMCDCSESYVRETVNEYRGGFDSGGGGFGGGGFL